MNEWIEECVAALKEMEEANPNTVKLSDPTLKWIKAMFKMAWENGSIEGANNAYENVQKWRETKNKPTDHIG